MKNRIKYFSVNCIIALLLLTVINGCEDDTDEAEPFETGTVTDVDNNVYKTVKIGNQWWMAQDLKVTKYRNGVPVFKVDFESQWHTDSVLWANDTTGTYCNNFDNAGKLIGRFYNHYAVNNTNKIAPEGWHIASDEEWKALEKHLGMNAAEADKQGWRGTYEGDKLKTEGELNWTKYGDVWGTNESGFSALALGCRLFNAEPGSPGYFATGFWWTATQSDSDDAWYRNLDYKNSNIFRSQCSKNYGYSVRCVKD